MQRTSNSHVTVSLPYFQSKSHLRRAVESILAQTHTNLTLVVVNDGDDDPPWDQLEDICDPRLIRFDLKSNHGRYFADAVVLNAMEAPYFLVQNAHDWSEPERIAISLEVLREDHADATISAEYQYSMINGEVVSKAKKGYPTMNRSLTYNFDNRASYRGLFKTEVLREIGGTYGGFRIGYGVLLIHFLLMTGRISYISDPLYHRVIQFDSFKPPTEPGMIPVIPGLPKSRGRRITRASRSIVELQSTPTFSTLPCNERGRDLLSKHSASARKEAALQLEKLYHETFELYIEYLSGQIEAKTLARLIRQISNRCVTQKDSADLIEESNRLRAILG